MSEIPLPAYLAALQAGLEDPNLEVVDGVVLDDPVWIDVEDLVDPEDGPVRPALSLVPDPDPEDASGHLSFEETDGVAASHRGWFTDRGIPIAWAEREFGARSIADRADFPTSLDWVASCGPAIRWDYQPIAGDGWSQIRSDKPPVDKNGRPRKYLGNSGESTGERLILNRTMRERLERGEYVRVIITEGTGQTMVASWVFADDESTLVVGVPGCWGWSAAGVGAPEINAVCKQGMTTFVAFDKDVETNPRVWDAGKRLSGTVQAATGQRPRFLRLPAGGEKTGFDDWASASHGILDGSTGDHIVDATEARRAVNNLLADKESAFLLGRTRPKETSSSLELLSGESPIPWLVTEAEATEDRRVCLNPWIRREVGGRVEVAARFAIRIAASYRVVDRLNSADGDIIHTLEIAHAGHVKRVADVRDAELHDVGSILRRAGIPHGSWAGGTATANYLVEVMKWDAEIREVPIGETLPHTGPHTGPDDEARWAVPSGIITATGHHADLGKALFDRGSNEAAIDLSVLADADDEKIRQAWLAERDVIEMFSDPTWHVTATGHQATAAAGMPSEGGLFLLGKAGGGKTQAAGWQSRRWGPGYRSHVLPGQSEANGSDIGQGLDGALAVLDDFKPFAGDPRKRAQAVGILEMIGRRAGDGEGEHSGRTGKRPGAAGVPWKQGTTDKAHPALVMSGEEFPAELDRSTRQRILTIQHAHRGLGEMYGDWKALDRAGKPRLALASFLQFVCGKVDQVGGWDAWREACMERRETITKRLLDGASIPDDDHRVAIVAAGRILGWALWTEAGQHFGAWGAEEARQLRKKGHALIAAAMVEHHSRHLADGDEQSDRTEMFLDAVRAADFQHDCIWRHKSSDERPGRFGWIGAEIPGEGVALVPKQVAEAIGWQIGDVKRALHDLTGETAAGVIKIDARAVRAYTVPKNRWEP